MTVNQKNMTKRGAPKGNRLKNRRAKEKKREAVSKNDEYVENPVEEEVKNIETNTMEEQLTDSEVAEETTEPIEEPSTENTEEINPPDNIDADQFDPLDEGVIERDYTKQGIGGGSEEVEEGGFEEEIPEAEFTAPPMDEDEFDDDIPDEDEPSGTKGEFDDDTDEPKNPKYEDLSPAQKRKAAQKTADALLKTYCKFIPIPFKRFASFNMDKLKRMEMKDEISLGMVVTADDETIRGHCEGVNAQVEEAFTITEDTKEEIREPLIDLLLEQELALSPSQRLGIAIGGHILSMGATTFQFMMENREAIKTFKEFHEDQKRNRTKPHHSEPHRPSPPPPTDDDKDFEDEPEAEAEAPDDSEEHVATEPSMDDYLGEEVEFEEVEEEEEK